MASTASARICSGAIPRPGLLGVYADHVRWEGLGGQAMSRGWRWKANCTSGRFSLEGMAGAEFGELEDRAFSRVTNLAMYPHEDLRLFVGHRYLGGDNALALGAEWQVAPRGVALFAEGLIGDETAAMPSSAGLRIYLAPASDKSLIRRHREDDPTNELKGAGQSLTGNLGPTCTHKCGAQ